MKRRISAIGILVSLLLGSCSSSVPILILEKTEVDLGQMTNGEVRTFEISIENQGGKDLVIEAVSTSCGCTSAEVEPRTIGPGESGTLHVTYDSGAHGPELNGPVLRQIFIASNDPDQPEVEFRIIVEVIPPHS